MAKPTPEKLLELANIVEPHRSWEISCNRVLDVEDDKNPWPYTFVPHIGNDAQLMKVVFALARKCKTIYQVTKLHDKFEMQDRKAIVNLAIEVLCNAKQDR